MPRNEHREKMTPHKRELALVMPVYNGEAGIAGVVGGWLEELAALGIDFELIVLDDGSSDATRDVLEPFRADGRVTLVRKRNEGHGPTILKGYGMAAGRAQWVFQTDSDNEVSPGSFKGLWVRRRDFDALFGERTGRVQATGRTLVSVLARVAVSLLFGAAVPDVNVPYRLIRSDFLSPLIREIPSGTFAPNVIITGMLAMSRARILNVPVPYQGGDAVSASLGGWRLWATAALSFFQTARFRLGHACRSRLSGSRGKNNAAAEPVSTQSTIL